MPSLAAPAANFDTGEFAPENLVDIWFNYNLTGRGFSLVLTNCTTYTFTPLYGPWILGLIPSRLELESVDLLVRPVRTRRAGWSIP